MNITAENILAQIRVLLVTYYDPENAEKREQLASLQSDLRAHLIKAKVSDTRVFLPPNTVCFVKRQDSFGYLEKQQIEAWQLREGEKFLIGGRYGISGVAE